MKEALMEEEMEKRKERKRERESEYLGNKTQNPGPHLLPTAGMRQNSAASSSPGIVGKVS